MLREDESLRFIPGRDNYESQPEYENEAYDDPYATCKLIRCAKGSILLSQAPEDVISSKFKKFVKEFTCDSAGLRVSKLQRSLQRPNPNQHRDNC